MTDFARTRIVDIKASQEPLELLERKTVLERSDREEFCVAVHRWDLREPRALGTVSFLESSFLLCSRQSVSFALQGSTGKLCLIFSKAQKRFHTFVRATRRQVKECRV